MPRLIIGCLLALAGLVGCARPEPPRPPAQGPDRTVLDNVRATGTLSALTDALEASGLAEALAAPGPLTLFAPADEAFAALPDSLRSRMLPDSPERYNVLTYHLIPDLLPAAAFDGRSVRTVNGASLSIERDGDGATVNRKSLVLDVLPASNGIVYVIDAVLLPPSLRGAEPTPR